MSAERTCRSCGCTDATPCIHPICGEPCSWVEPDLCDFCAEEAEPLVRVYSEGEANQYLRAHAAAGGSF